MSIRLKPIAVPPPSVQFPAADASLAAEVVRLRRMVHTLAEMLVECGIVDASIVEGRLHLACVDVEPLDFTPGEVSLKKPSWWARLWRKPQVAPPVGAVPAMMMPVDQTVPVQKLPFEVQSLYDETGGPSVVSPGQAMTMAARAAVGNCSRCWKRAPLNSGQLCVRCGVQAG